MKLQRFTPNTKNFSAQYCRYVKRKQTVTLNDIMAKQGKKTKFDPLRNYGYEIGITKELPEIKVIGRSIYVKIRLVGEWCWVYDKDIRSGTAHHRYVKEKDLKRLKGKCLTTNELASLFNVSNGSIRRLSKVYDVKRVATKVGKNKTLTYLFDFNDIINTGWFKKNFIVAA